LAFEIHEGVSFSVKHLVFASAALVFTLPINSLLAQQTPGPAFSSDVAAERIPNLDKLKAELRQYHECTCKCGCYTRDMDVQADRAIAFLRQRAARRNANGKSGAQEKLAMILDIDETTLSNYSEEVGADFAYNPGVFDAWVQSAKAPAIAGTLRLYKEAQRLGVNIIFITGREEGERDATERNLRAVGFDNWQQLFMRPADDGWRSIGEYKAVIRAQLVAAGYKLVLNVGDQWSDLKGKPDAEFSVKYPDPYYFIP
jgi:acid phosphatase